MDFRFFEPAPCLQGCISAYIWYQAKGLQRSEPFRFIPSGSPYMVFNLGDPITIHNALYQKGTIEKDDLVIGQQDVFFKLTPGPHLSHLCIVFQPTGLTRLLNIPVHELLNDADSLEYLVKASLQRLVNIHREGKCSLDDVVRRIDAWFCDQLLHHSPDHLFVEYTIRRIREKNGLVTVTELADISNTCVRNYRRRFLEITGISPKKFIMLTRLKKILHALEYDQPLKISWKDITYQAGYFDQMHFIKEFKRFCGETPTAYLKKYSKSRFSLEQYLLSIVD
jgi:AraC-like DNA-binding protein